MHYTLTVESFPFISGLICPVFSSLFISELDISIVLFGKLGLEEEDFDLLKAIAKNTKPIITTTLGITIAIINPADNPLLLFFPPVPVGVEFVTGFQS